MKNIIVILPALFFSLYLGAQSQQIGSERKVAIELNQRTNFFSVNDRYQIIEDTVYYTNTGFLVYPDYDVIQLIDGKEYVVLTYPEYKKGTIQQAIKSGIDITTKMVKENTSQVYSPLTRKNGLTLMILKEDFEKIDKTTLYDISFRRLRNYQLSTGLLTVPFKLRPKQNNRNFSITTDVTLGPYFGITKRLSKRNPFYATIPATLGLSFINLNNHTTSNADITKTDVSVVPGVSWSSGLIFQINHFNIGFVFGKDYSSGVGEDWIYQKKFWYSFAIGYGFLNDTKVEGGE